MPQDHTQVDCNDRISFYDRRILEERKSIYLAWILAGAAIVSGIILAILTYFFVPDTAKLVGTVGSGFVPLLAGFPLKDYLAQKTKISTYSDLRSSYETILHDPEKAEAMQLDKLEELYWKLKNKLAGAV